MCARPVHTEQQRIFAEESGLAESCPDVRMEFSRPDRYPELLADGHGTCRKLASSLQTGSIRGPARKLGVGRGAPAGEPQRGGRDRARRCAARRCAACPAHVALVRCAGSGATRATAARPPSLALRCAGRGVGARRRRVVRRRTLDHVHGRRHGGRPDSVVPARPGAGETTVRASGSPSCWPARRSPCITTRTMRRAT